MQHLELINTLHACVIACNHCADACLDVDQVSMMTDCIRTDRACAEVCKTTATLLASGFTEVNDLVAYCKDLCETCGDECAQHNHQHCKDCAQACRDCVTACKAFLA